MLTKTQFLHIKKQLQKPLFFLTAVLSILLFTHCTTNSDKKNADKKDNISIEKEGQLPAPNKEAETEPAKKPVDKAIELTDKDFNSTINQGVVLVDFWAAWCAPCRTLGPTIDELAKEMSDKVTIAKLNVDQYNAISLQYDVRNIPTIIIFKNGKLERRFLGIQTKEFLKQQIEELI